ncbi:MAG: UDP-N-acetylmuramoyl-tripeptide--D-alanyl-D-alanine ligase [Lautropia sp.]|nr:UDP-N-acetylmuramoyl-tripeptide--D-alanyl-D-alanine ligase [Lautropia sp.]
MFDLRTAYQWVPLAVMIGRGDTWFSGVSTDTRSVKPGDLFVALKGDRFDGHQFIDEAMAAGAAGVLVDQWPKRRDIPMLVVPSARKALGQLAEAWRARFDLPVIAVTGSNGKTTVKEMIASVLAAHFGPDGALVTEGNLNNDIGVPLTILRLRAHHQAAVIELGMNHPGEIAVLTRIAQPTIGLVLNAQREHQEFMDGPEATARENGAVLQGMAKQGIAIFPGDDPCNELWYRMKADRFSLEFGLCDSFDTTLHMVCALASAHPSGFEARIAENRFNIRLNIAGRHNVRNALAALVCTWVLPVSPATIEAGLAAFRPVAGRLCREQQANGLVLIDDTYNANPDSMRAAVDVLTDEAGPRLIVMGDMGETGAQAGAFHREVGQYAREQGIEMIWAVGQDMKVAAEAAGDKARHWASVEDLLAEHPTPPPGVASILVKGSRFMRMERIVRAWSDTSGQPSTAPHGAKPSSDAGDA